MFGREREKFKSDENKLLIAKVIDKYKFSKTKNKITYTDFLTISEISIIKKFLKQENIKNYIFFGGRKDADRNVLIFYPEKIIDNTTDIIQKNYKNIFQVIRIKLPNNIKYIPAKTIDISSKLLLKLSNILYLESKFNFLLLSHFIICQSPLIHLEILDIKLVYFVG